MTAEFAAARSRPHKHGSPASPPGRFELASRMSRMSTSAVREILKVAERPDVISFAGGLPAPELFPIAELAQAHAEVFGEQGQAALQYSVTEGYGPLREWICQRMASRGIRAAADQVLVLNGSQQGIDLVGKVLLEKGSAVAVENPSYLAALQCFGGYEATFTVVDSDDEGMRVDELEDLVHRQRPRLIYVVTDFHNPKGTSLSLSRRRQLLGIAQAHRIPILEDDPYGELRFRGQMLPPLAALDDAGVVIYQSTFSKTLVPGMRLGWLYAPTELVKSLTIAKQAADLHTATLAQRAAAALLSKFDYAAHLERIRACYGERCQAMLEALEQHMPPGTRWTRPDGGLFLWLQLPGAVDGERLLAEAVEQKVAFVPGSPFFAERVRHDFMRLNFSNRSPELIAEGIARLGKVVHRHLAEKA